MAALTLLTDRDLEKLVDPQKVTLPLITGLDNKWLTPNHIYDAESPVQPVSVDLTIGSIVLPGSEDGQLGSPDCPYTNECDIAPGGTAYIVTHEEVHLPANVAAFGFPPFSLSASGLLLTSVGHIDPGWDGPLRLVVVNMRQKPARMKFGEKIATILFFRLPQKCAAPYNERHSEDQDRALFDRERIAYLPDDFGHFTARAREIATKEAKAVMADLRWKFIGGLLGAAILIPTILITSVALVDVLRTKWVDASTKVEALQKEVSKINLLEEEVRNLRASISAHVNTP